MKIVPSILAIYISAFALNAQSLTTNPGDPLPGLSANDLKLFQAGRAEFLKQYEVYPTDADGTIQRASLNTCAGCHQFPAVGGGDATFDVSAHRRTSTPLFGAGLIDAIPDETILALQNRREALALGIGGRAAMVPDSTTGRLRVGRFGWKAQYATLLDASVDNLAKYMGVPESVSRIEVPDSTGLRTIDRLAAFSRLLAPVSQLTTNPAAAGIFNGIGCQVCHIQTITIPLPPAGSPASISPFSDFLLHDIGTGESIAQGAALPNEIRTAPLWGLRLRKLLLHDGSALTLEDAIRAHRGEASIVRQRFDALTGPERQALIEYLKTL